MRGPQFGIAILGGFTTGNSGSARPGSLGPRKGSPSVSLDGYAHSILYRPCRRLTPRLLPKLVGSAHRSLDHKCDTAGVQIRVGQIKSTVKINSATVETACKSRGTVGFEERSDFTHSKRCNRNGGPKLAGVLRAVVPCTQKERRVETSTRSLTAQQISSQKAIQNGNGYVNTAGFKTRGLGNIHRSHGCLLPYFNPSIGPKIPTVPMARKQSVSIQSTTFRSKPKSVDFYTVGKRASSSYTPQSHQVPPLPRRLVDTSSVSGTVQAKHGTSVRLDTVTRVQSKPGQKRPSTVATVCLSGAPVRYRTLDRETHRGKGGCTVEASNQYQSSTVIHGDFNSIPAGSNREHGLGHPDGQNVQETIAESFGKPLDTNNPRLRCENSNRSMVPLGGECLDGQRVASLGCAHCAPRGHRAPGDGCVLQRLGCPHRPGYGQRSVVTEPVETTYQLERAEMCVSSGATFFSPAREFVNSNRDGQHHGGGLYQPSGGSPLTLVVNSSREPDSFLPSEQHSYCGEIHSRAIECDSRLLESQRPNSQDRMDSNSQSVRQSLGQVSQTNDRSVCDQILKEAPRVRCTSTRRAGVESGCLQLQLERPASLCLSPNSSSSKGPEQVSTVSNGPDSSSSVVAGQALVSATAVPGPRGLKTGPESRRPSSTSIRRPAFVSSHARLARVALVKKRLRAKGASANVAETVSLALRPSSAAVYAAKWKLWVNFCQSKGINPLDCSVFDVTNFLSFLHVDKSYGSGSLKVAKSAILTTLNQYGNRPKFFNQFPRLVKDFIQGVINKEAKSKTRAPSWDLATVLEFIRGKLAAVPLDRIPLDLLTYCTCFLLTFALAFRASDVAGLSGRSSDILFNSDGSVSLAFLPEYRAKTKSLGSESSILVKCLCQSLCSDDLDKFLCPVCVLKVYLKRSNKFRAPVQRRLFISINPNYRKDIRKSCISRWLAAIIKLALSAANSTSFSARVHEIRALASSFAFAHQTPLPAILRAAGWRRELTFINHYLRDVSSSRQDGSFALSAVAAGAVILNN